MKGCRKCDVELVVGENWYPSSAKNHNPICIKCQRACQLEYRKNHREERRAYMRDYGPRHREEKAAYDRQRRQENLEEIRAYDRQRYLGRKEWKAEYDRKYRQKHKERIRACQRKSERQRYHKNLEESRAKVREKANYRRARKANTAIEPVDEEKIYELYNYTCIYCGVIENLSLDHIVPLDGGGPHCEDNLVVACRSCNSSKHTKPLEDWLQAQPRAQAWVM